MKDTVLRPTLRFMQWVALTYLMVLGALMLYDAVRARPTLKDGQEHLSSLKTGDMENPELARTVRELDYLYRATYFQTRDRRAHGFLLMGLGFVGLCLLMAVDLFFFGPSLKIPRPNKSIAEKERRQTLVYTGAVLLALGMWIIIQRGLLFGSPQSTEDNKGISATPSPTPPIPLSEAMEEARDHWPQFRGSILPNRNPLPPHWDFQVRWQATIPLEGFNSPVVWGDRVFVAGGNRTERALFAFDALTGDLRWKTPTGLTPKLPDVSDDTGLSAPTPAVDRERVYAVFATGEVVACTHDGVVVWRRQLPTPEILYGYASSPLLLGDRLIVQYDLEETHILYALDVHTGRTQWETRRDAAPSWSTPTALLMENGARIFTAGNRFAEWFDAEDGRPLWRQECMGGEVATTATPTADGIFFSNTGAFTGALSPTDGNVLFRNDNAPAPDVSSPVWTGETYLLFSSGGSVIALDARTGEELHETNFDNGFYASPVSLGGKIVAVNLDGELFLLNAQRERLTVEGRYAVGQRVVATPAFHGGRIIVRTADNALICLEARPR